MLYSEESIFVYYAQEKKLDTLYSSDLEILNQRKQMFFVVFTVKPFDHETGTAWPVPKLSLSITAIIHGHTMIYKLSRATFS